MWSTYEGEGVQRALLAQLQDGVGHMVVEGAQDALPQALLCGNAQALHEHIQSLLILPLPQQTHPLQHKVLWSCSGDSALAKVRAMTGQQLFLRATKTMASDV